MADNSEYRPGALIPGTKYKVIRKLGAGGMGTVYEVEDTTIDKRYVLKTLNAQYSTRADLAARMDKEAKALARLEHKNIVQVITADVTSDALKLQYFVMEKLSGHSLRTVLDNKGSLEVDAACRLMIDVLNALYHAHENRIIHRDVKPDNIFLHRDRDGVTVPKLLDFGVMTSSDSVTMTGHRFIGTLRYAAPEQLLGDKVSPQTDLYAAGLVLYEAIAGRGPFDDVGDSMAVASAHLHKVPPKISEFKPVPPALEQVIMSSLAKDPNERPRDAFAFAAELNRLRRGLQAAQPSNTSGVATVEAILPMTDPASTPILVESLETAREGDLRGPTSPARQPDAGAATEHRVGAMSGGGHTLEDAAPPSMTVGAPAPPAHAPPGVDRSAPTTTYVADSPRRPSQGDTLLMDPSEPRNSGATVRMAPLPGLTDPRAPAGRGEGTLSPSVPDAPRSRGRRASTVAVVTGATLLGLVVLALLGMRFMSRAAAVSSGAAAPSASLQAAAPTPQVATTATVEESPSASAVSLPSTSPPSEPVVVTPPAPRPPTLTRTPAVSAAPRAAPPPPAPAPPPITADSAAVPKKKKLPASGL